MDIEGTKRCFSDGVGKLSQAMLDKIYEQSQSLAAKRPTVFQIRYGWAETQLDALQTGVEGNLCIISTVPFSRIRYKHHPLRATIADLEDGRSFSSE